MKIRTHENEIFYFISVPYTITDFQALETLQYIPRGANWNDVKNVLFSSSKCETKNQLKHKNQVRNRLFIASKVLEYEGLYLSLRGQHINKNVYINFNKNNENLEIFCLQVTGYLKTRKSLPICMFVVLASGKCDLHIHFTILQEF